MYFFFLQCSAISLIFRSKKSEDSRVDIFKDIADGTLIIHNITNNNTADLDDERRKEFARSLSEISAQPTTPFNLMILLNFQSAILAGILFDYQRVNSLYKVEIIVDELAWAYSKSLFGGSFVNIAPFESDDLSLYLFYLYIYKKSVRLGNTPNLLSSSLEPDTFISLLESSSKTRTQAETFVKIFRHSKPDIKCDCLIQFFELCEAFISSCNYCVSEGWLESIIQKYSKKENLNIKLLKDQIADFTQCVNILKEQLGDVRNEILVWEALPQYVKVDIDDVKGSDESTMTNPSIKDIRPELGGNESAGLTSTLASENKGPIESETDRVKLLDSTKLKNAIKSVETSFERLSESVFSHLLSSNTTAKMFSDITHQHNAILAIVQIFSVDMDSSDFEEHFMSCLKRYTANYILSKMHVRGSLVKKLESILQQKRFNN